MNPTSTINVNGVDYVPASEAPAPSPIRILVLQRGWVIVGRVASVDETEIVITGASTIRAWGTTKGLGELVDGPTSSTKLDPCGVCRVHPLAVVLSIDTKESTWAPRVS